MSHPIKATGVVGLGVMGFDIAFLYAAKGYETLVYDASAAAMESLETRRQQTVEKKPNQRCLGSTGLEYDK